MSDYEPKEFDYNLIRGCVHKYLWKSHHERHLEDCIQDVSMQWFEGNTNIQWAVINYCRKNGITENGKLGAKTMERATLVGLASDENEGSKEMGFLLDLGAIAKFEDEQDIEKEQDARQTFMGRLEEFLLPMNLKQETLIWVKKHYQPRSKTNAKIFNTLPKLST